MWQSFFGYVMIRISGYGLERFLNLIHKAGIPIIHVRRENAMHMTAEIRAKHFFRLREISPKLRCRVHILKRRGIPFWMARLRTRKALVISGILLFLLLVFAQSRMWAVSVEGSHNVPKSVVEQALVKANVRIGMARNDIDNLELGSAVRMYDDRIAWAGVHLDGVVLKVQVVEAEPIPELPDLSRPADIIASRDGVITNVIATSGRARVKPGDVVRKGETLIHGNITREGAKQMFVCAQGRVEAMVHYNASVPVVQTEKQLLRSGQNVPYRSLLVAGQTVYESDVPYDHFEVETKNDRLVTNIIIPVRILSGICYELTERDVMMESEEQIANAAFQAEYNALQAVPKDARILDKTSEMITYGDGRKMVASYIRTLEEIGEMRYLDNG